MFYPSVTFYQPRNKRLAADESQENDPYGEVIGNGVQPLLLARDDDVRMCLQQKANAEFLLGSL